MNGVVQGRQKILINSDTFPFEEISLQSNAILSSLTTALNIHLNLNQSLQINTDSIEFSLEKLPKKILAKRLNASGISFPSDFLEMNETILVRVSLVLIEIMKRRTSLCRE